MQLNSAIFGTKSPSHLWNKTIINTVDGIWTNVKIKKTYYLFNENSKYFNKSTFYCASYYFSKKVR